MFRNMHTCAQSAQLTNAYQTAAILVEVLKGVNLIQSIEVDHEMVVSIDIGYS